MRSKILNVAIVGCGKIADQHADAIKHIKNCKLVAACDQEKLMTEQFCDRYKIEKKTTDPLDIAKNKNIDVVHITTPPGSHYELGKLFLNEKKHVYMEKPFTLKHHEAVELLDTAKIKELKITCGHNLQFSKEQAKMRALVKDGFLGGKPVHMESIYCYNLGDEKYAKALLGDQNHWIRKLPGKLFHNIISHGISKISEFLSSDNPDVFAIGFTSTLLRKIGERDIIDELRVVIKDKENVTGNFIFSTTIGPMQNQFRIFGPKNGIVVDHINRTTVKLNHKSYKSFLNYFLGPAKIGNEYIKNSINNIACFIRNDFHDDAGMRSLIRMFYDAIVQNEKPPIAYSEIERTSYIMDNIIRQVYSYPTK